MFEGGTEDLSYLDEATAAPDVPTAAPAAKKQEACHCLVLFGDDVVGCAQYGSQILPYV